MASSVIGALRVNLGLDSAQFSTGIKKAEGSMGAFHKSMIRLAAAAGGLLGSILAAGALREASDKWSDLSSRVGMAVGSMSQAPHVMERISKMARASYSDLGQTAEAFIANRTALADLGYTTDKQLDYTEALNNALVISGAKGDRAASVQNALSVAMATGKLSGDGLNSVLAHGGRIAQALAEKLGTNVSGLRSMGAKGKVTASVISGALIGSLEKLRNEAGEMPATIGDGFTLLGNAMLRLIGMFDQVAGASGGVASAIVAIADGIDWVADAIAANSGVIITALNTLAASAAIVGVAFATRYAVSIGVTAVAAMRGAVQQSIALEMALGAQSRSAALASASVKLLSGALTALKGAIISTGIGALVVGAGYLIAKFMQLVSAAGGFGEALSLVGALASEVWDRIKLGAQGIGKSIAAIAVGIRASFGAAFAWVLQKLAELTQSVANGINGMFEAVGVDLGLKGMGAELAKEMSEWVEEERRVAARLGVAADRLYSDAAKPLESWQKLKDVMAGVDAETEDAIASADALGNSLSTAGGKGSQKLSDAAKVMKSLREEAEKLSATMNMSDLQAQIWSKQREAGVKVQSIQGKQIAGLVTQIDRMKKLKDATEEWRSSISGAFASFITQGGSFKNVLSQIIGKLAEMLAQQAFTGLIGAGSAGGGFLSGALKMLGFANGTNFAPGGLARVHERGGEIMNLPRGTQVIPHDISKRMADRASQGGVTAVQIALAPELIGQILQQSGAQTVQIVQANNRALPEQIKKHQAKPRLR